MPKKLSREEVAKWFEDRGSKLVSVYENNRSRIIYLCSKCGREIEAFSFSILKTRGGNCLCRECFYESRRVGKDSFKEEFESRGAELIEFHGYNHPFKYRCPGCKEVIEKPSISNFLNQNKSGLCESCLEKRYSVEAIREYLKGMGATLLSEPKTFLDRLEFSCSECGGLVSYCSFTILKIQNPFAKCIRCSRKEFLKHTKEYVETFVRAQGSELLVYENSYSSFSCKCVRCSSPISVPSFSHVLSRGNKENGRGVKARLLCRVCRKIEFRPKLKVSVEEVSKWFEGRGSKLLSYVSSMEPISFVCTKCGGKSKYTSMGDLRRNNSELECNKCRRAKYRGKNSPHWNPELTETERQRVRINKPEYVKWMKGVDHVYGEYCAISGRSLGHRGHHHHLFSWRKNHELRLCVWNGVLLDKSVHKMFHIKYGGKGFTYFDFAQFYKEFTGKDFYLIKKGNVWVEILPYGIDVDYIRARVGEHTAKGIEYHWFIEDHLYKKEVIEFLDSLIRK